MTKTIEDNLNKAVEKQKFNKTSHMLRNVLRKEKATANLFKSGQAISSI